MRGPLIAACTTLVPEHAPGAEGDLFFRRLRGALGATDLRVRDAADRVRLGVLHRDACFPLAATTGAHRPPTGGNRSMKPASASVQALRLCRVGNSCVKFGGSPAARPFPVNAR